MLSSREYRRDLTGRRAVSEDVQQEIDAESVRGRCRIWCISLSMVYKLSLKLGVGQTTTCSWTNTWPKPRSASARLRAMRGSSSTRAKRSGQMKGMGRVYKRGNVYWIEYWHRGKQYRESSKSSKESDAWKLLRRR